MLMVKDDNKVTSLNLAKYDSATPYLDTSIF
jgi:hypothetical protein